MFFVYFNIFDKIKTDVEGRALLAEESRINLLYLIRSKQIINADRFKKSVGVRYFDILNFEKQ